MTRAVSIVLLAMIPAWVRAQGKEAPGQVNDLPLVEVPATGAVTDVLAVIVSGDGGWACIDRTIADRLAARGVAVVGLNALKYFWIRRTPDGAAHDLERILRHYLAAWHRQKIILIGYSRGADVLPFMADRLPEELRSRIALIVLMGPELAVSFEFHLTDWLWNVSRPHEFAVLPEVEKLRGMNILCVHGKEEEDSLCSKLPSGLATILALPGGHHFAGHYDEIARRILDEVLLR
jgi:type IV secretory pathway VirJ component